VDHNELMLMHYIPAPGDKSFYVPITLEDVARTYPTQELLSDYEPKYEGDVVALGRAVYETTPQGAADHLLRLAVSLSHIYAPGNLWVLPTHERLPYPYAVYWPLCNAFQTEKNTGRRFDWFVWMDDDVFVTPNDWQKLMAAADPVERPFVAALGYDRLQHHRPAVSEIVDGERRMWLKAPKSGTHAVHTTGLVCAVFHRSLFDRVPEPWFGVAPAVKGASGVNPDWWWSYRLHAAGITPYVCCDTDVIHLGAKSRINRAYSEKYIDACDAAGAFPSAYIRPENRAVSEATGAMTILSADVKDGRQE